MIKLVLSRMPLLVLQYLLFIVGVVLFVFRKAELTGGFRILSYMTFVAWIATYAVIWKDWKRQGEASAAKVRPKTPDEHSTIVNAVHNFTAAGITAVSILLPAVLAIIGFRLGRSQQAAGLAEAAFWLTISLAVALWNLSRLPTMVHFKEKEDERENVAYEFWTAFLEMVQLGSLLLGLLLLLLELFSPS